MATLTFTPDEVTKGDVVKFEGRCPACGRGRMSLTRHAVIDIDVKFTFTCEAEKPCPPVTVVLSQPEVLLCASKEQFAALVSNKYASASRRTTQAQQRREEAPW